MPLIKNDKHVGFIYKPNLTFQKPAKNDAMRWQSQTHHHNGHRSLRYFQISDDLSQNLKKPMK